LYIIHNNFLNLLNLQVPITHFNLLLFIHIITLHNITFNYYLVMFLLQLVRLYILLVSLIMVYQTCQQLMYIMMDQIITVTTFKQNITLTFFNSNYIYIYLILIIHYHLFINCNILCLILFIFLFLTFILYIYIY